jgi:cytochrome c oxidase cbb3-type subunit III
VVARIIITLSILTISIAGAAWLRIDRASRPTPIAGAQRALGVEVSPIAAGGGAPPVRDETPIDPSGYESTGFAVSQGAQLYRYYNCVGCHAQGGGGIGVALLDDHWVYGREPAQIYQTIVEGRSNGMPSFRNKLTEQQVWQLTAYVRAMGRLEPAVLRPARDDHMQARPPLSLQDPMRWGEALLKLVQ